MSNYVKTVDFAAKDALVTGNPAKAGRGTEVDTEFNNIATAIATKLDSEDFVGGDATANVGYLNNPQNAQTGNYTLVIGDAGKHIFHASGAGASDVYTIPANSSVAFPIGTYVTFVNLDSNSVSIQITSDTMQLAGSTSTGNRTLSQNGVATALKVSSTSWLIFGTGLG